VARRAPSPDPAAAAEVLEAAPIPVAVSNPLFNLLLCIVVGICLLSFAGACALAFAVSDQGTEFQRQFASMCDMGWKLTLGAVVGLLGGRAAKPDRLQRTQD
jgi:hypothetical protein